MDDSSKQVETEEIKNQIPSSSSNEEVVIIGNDLSSTDPPAEIVLPSDQESTEGEQSDDEKEDISALSPSLLLFRAAGAHNLPVMCKALALGADVHAPHPDPSHHSKTPLHAAVISVSISYFNIWKNQ